jgi:hypothetical protein
MELRDLDLNLLLVLDALYEEGTLTRDGAAAAAEPTACQRRPGEAPSRTRRRVVRAGGVMQPTARAEALQPVVSSVLKTIRIGFLALAGFKPGSAMGAFTLSLSDIGELEFLPAIAEANLGRGAQPRNPLSGLQAYGSRHCDGFRRDRSGRRIFSRSRFLGIQGAIALPPPLGLHCASEPTDHRGGHVSRRLPCRKAHCRCPERTCS